MKTSDSYANSVRRVPINAFTWWSWALLTIAAINPLGPRVASAQEVTGENMKFVEVGLLGKDGRETIKRGDYRVIEPGVWQYKESPFTGYQTITLHYAERSRDAWSVYLEPIEQGLGRGGSHQSFPKTGQGRNIKTTIQIDLYRKKTLFEGSSSTLLDVITSSTTAPDVVNGQNVALVKYRWIGGGPQGYFRNDNGTGWEQIENGTRKAIFYQTSRDPWSVYLTDGKSQRLRLDLYYMQV